LANTYGVKRRGKRWQARPYVPGHGWIWVGTYDSREEAREQAVAKLAEFRRLPAHRETCKSFADRWVRDYPRPKQSTNDLNASRARVFAKEFGSTLLRDVDRPAAREWARKHHSAASSIRAMFSDAVNDGLLAENPFANLRLPGSRGRKDIEVLSAEEVGRLADLAESHHGKAYGRQFRALVIFAAYTTMRPSEIYGLERADVDFRHNEIIVRRQFYKRTLTLPKNGKTRRIILPPPAAEALKSMPAFTPVRGLTDEKGVERDVNFIFRNKIGAPLSPSGMHYYFDPVRIAFGRPELEFYVLRHTGATYMVETLGLPAWVVAKQLGHTDGGILVSRLYAHPSDNAAREQIRRAYGMNVSELREVKERKASNG
jgi:integrase